MYEGSAIHHVEEIPAEFHTAYKRPAGSTTEGRLRGRRGRMKEGRVGER